MWLGSKLILRRAELRWAQVHVDITFVVGTSYSISLKWALAENTIETRDDEI
jgi:hypothetical protein